MFKLQGWNGFVILFSSINVYAPLPPVRMVGSADVHNGAQHCGQFYLFMILLRSTFWSAAPI